MADATGARGLLSYFARHRTVANLLLVLMIAAGVVAFPRMRAQFFPDTVVSDVEVSVSWDGAGASDVDRAIVQVLEPALRAVEGVTDSSSRASEGRARISLEFEPGWDMDRAQQDVEETVDGISNLPDAADDPEIRSGGWSDRVTDVVIRGPVGVDQLARFADELVLRLFEAGVTQTTVSGVAAPSTIVEVPSIRLIENDVTLSQIASAIAAEADASPAGDVSGTARVRTGSAKRSAEEIAGIVLRSNPDGSSLTVGDVAEITVEGVDRDRAYYVGDDPAVMLSVRRSARGDAIELQQAVETATREIQAGLPEGVRVELVNTSAEVISDRLRILLDNGLMGLGLVLALLFLFLNARTAIWVAMGIPVAMAAAVALMYVSGLTLNMMSLFALILTLGIVVDDAIVVGEHADFRARRLGESPVVAAETAARRMFLPVFSASLTTIIAFLGLTVIGGRFGDMISDIPFTIIAVLLASLVECFLILPNHMSHSVGTDRQPWYDWPSRQVNRGFGWVQARIFRPFMAGVVWLRYPVLAGAVLLLASQAALFIRGDVQWQFFSGPESGSVSGNFAMLPGAAREDTMAQMRELQRATEAVGAEFEAEYGLNPISYVIAQIGGSAGRGLAGADTKESYQLGAISIELIDPDLRPYSGFDFVSRLQDAVVQHPLAETVSFRSFGWGPGGDDIDIQIAGSTADRLKEASEALKQELLQFPEVSAVEDNLAYDKEELILQLTARGQALGFTIDDLGGVLRDRLNGIEAATYPDGQRSATIEVQLPPEELTADFLDRTQMRTTAGEYVPLSDIVTVTRETGFSTLRRENGVMLITVSGDLTDDADRAAEIQQLIDQEILPRIESNHGVSTSLSGLAEQERDFLADAEAGLIFCLTGIYLVLAWIFSSWTRPLVVMSVIPFGLVGAIWGHYLWQMPMSLFSIVGLLGMVGIIINDSIVLVTTIDEYSRDRGLIPAIIDGTADRLRPVLLTTLTTVLGLAPLLYEGSSQAEFLKPTVVTLVFGLAFGMVLVLLVVPALMAIQHDIARQVAAARRALLRGAPGARAPTAAAALAAVVLFAATVGPVLVTGAPLPAMAGVPLLSAGVAAAFAAFALALGAVIVVIYAVAAVAAARRGAGAGA